MFLICWNVAGLSTTLQRINRDYSKPTNDKTNPKTNPQKHHAFSHFLKKHGDPDIVCIQEHKIPLKQLSSRSEPYQCTSIPNYDSFWSCCTNESKKGFNGVVTYVKKHKTRKATNTPFQNQELDNQGRCVMTDHGSFVVFNVYAPAGGGNPLSYKMKFLNALKKCMDYQSEVFGKKVFLVGDLNIAHRGIDRHWKCRGVNLNFVLKEVEEFMQSGANDNKDGSTTRHEVTDENDDEEHNKVTPVPPDWKIQLAKHWNTIEKSLSNIQVHPVTTKNMSTGSIYEKYRAFITLGGENSESGKTTQGRKVFIGKAESTKEECLSMFSFPEYTYYDEDLQKDIIAKEANVIPIDTLNELMSKLVNVEWSSSTLSCIKNTDDEKLNNLPSPSSAWLTGLLDNDNGGMMDAFRFLHPLAKGRFTCWDQRTNNRFDNLGVRLDYTILDKSISNYIDTTTSKKLRLRCCNYPIEKDYNTEEASLHAATASGQFQGASFDGGGIVDATQRALDSQFGDDAGKEGGDAGVVGNKDDYYTKQRHTGIIYTPPSYSDHVAVSLLLNDKFRQEHLSMTLQLDLKCPCTKKAQPHRSQTSISSFFGNKGKVNGSGNINGNDGSRSKKKNNAQIITNTSNKSCMKSLTLSKAASASSSSPSMSKNLLLSEQSSRKSTLSKIVSSSSSSSTNNKSLKRKSSTEIKSKSSSQKKKGTLHSFFKK